MTRQKSYRSDNSDVLVITVPDAKYGEEIIAWIKLKPGVQVSEEELKTFC
jgi:fatty-acyl-CoA synthase